MNVLTLWAIFGYYIYFCAKGIYMFFVGSGAGFPNLFIYWTVTAPAAVVFFYRKAGNLRGRSGILIFLGVVFGVILYVTNAISDSRVKIMSDTVNYYILSSFPAMLIGIVAGKKHKAKHMEPCIDYIILLFFIALSLSYIKAGGSRFRISLGGASYQNFSYCAAYGVLLDLYMIIYADKSKLHRIFKNRIYKILRLVYLPLFFVYQIAGGGRGALVLVCVGILIIVADKVALNKKWAQATAIIIVVVAGFILMMPVIQENAILNEQFTRATAFIDDTGAIDLENGSSGRDKIYETAIKDIKKHPVFGYGPMGQLKERQRYCHNLYLDVLYEGGVVYFTVWVTITIFLIKKLIKRVREDDNEILYLFLFACTFIMLMFSAYYPMQGGLWYFIGCVFSVKSGRRKRRCYLNKL